MDKIIERFRIFIESKGGARTVAEKLNKHPNKFYVTFRGETLPSSNTISEIKLAFPDLDINWLFTGVTSDNQELITLETPVSDIEKEYKALQEKAGLFEKMLEETKARLEKTEDQLDAERKVLREMTSKMIPFIPNSREEVKTGTGESFSETSEEAPVYSLNFDGVDYHPVRRIGFAPSYLENADSLVKNA